jgi:hypothetical protein
LILQAHYQNISCSDLREERAVVNDRRAPRRRIEIGSRKLAADAKKQQQQRGQQDPREQ